MNSPAPAAPDWVRTFYTVVAVIAAIVTAIMMIVGAPWRAIVPVVLPAILFGVNANHYRPTPDIQIAASPIKIFLIVGSCSIPPIGLVLIFFDSEPWRGWFILLALISVSLGPLLLLRRYFREPVLERPSESGGKTDAPKSTLPSIVD